VSSHRGGHLRLPLTARDTNRATDWPPDRMALFFEKETT
jgi:hypothetical protein